MLVTTSPIAPPGRRSVLLATQKSRIRSRAVRSDAVCSCGGRLGIGRLTKAQLSLAFIMPRLEAARYRQSALSHSSSARLPASVILTRPTLLVGPPREASQSPPLRARRAQALPACRERNHDRAQARPRWRRADCWREIGAPGATPGWSEVFAVTGTVRPSSDSPPKRCRIGVNRDLVFTDCPYAPVHRAACLTAGCPAPSSQLRQQRPQRSAPAIREYEAAKRIAHDKALHYEGRHSLAHDTSPLPIGVAADA
jgi:hypothetical protein